MLRVAPDCPCVEDLSYRDAEEVFNWGPRLAMCHYDTADASCDMELPLSEKGVANSEESDDE